MKIAIGIGIIAAVWIAAAWSAAGLAVVSVDANGEVVQVWHAWAMGWPLRMAIIAAVATGAGIGAWAASIAVRAEMTQTQAEALADQEKCLQAEISACEAALLAKQETIDELKTRLYRADALADAAESEATALRYRLRNAVATAERWKRKMART